ncbi:MAG: inositol monophosphatase family protein [Candidatus Woesearchaeota archaeon]
MDWNTEQLTQLCKNGLQKAHSVLEALSDQGINEVHDAHVTDISTKGDMAVSKTLARFLEEQRIPAVLYSEESGRIELTKNPKYTITFDDIDGTDNYHRGRGMLPYCTVVTIFDSLEPKFEDALVGGIIEHNSKNLWHAVRDGGCYLNGLRVTTSGRKNLDRRTLVIIDHYAGAGEISKLLKIYPDSWVKDFGSAALHLAGVSSGLFDAYLSPSQKAHELGAGYLLIKEAGGFLTDLNANPLDRVKYDFDAMYSIIAASTPELGKVLLSKL